MREISYPRRELQLATAISTAWLSEAKGSPLPDHSAEETWSRIRRAVAIQGIGPYLHTRLLDGEGPAYPEHFRCWLAEGYRLNSARVARMRAELASIFRGARRAGIRVMVLKGGAMAGRYYPDPAIRPMADLDLLVRAADLPGLCAQLEQLGYKMAEVESAQAADRHLRFQLSGDRIHSTEFEHPDNPRPVEVHTGVDVPLWGDVKLRLGRVDPWTSPRLYTVEGELGWAPDDETMLQIAAFHHLQHLMVNTGRAIQWVDLCRISSRVAEPLCVELADWLYPAMRLATRAISGCRAGVDPTEIQEAANPVIARWAERVPLDSRCGLNLGLPPELRSRWLIRWERWQPSPWRLAFAYPSQPYLMALGRHLTAMVRRLTRSLLSPPKTAE